MDFEELEKVRREFGGFSDLIRDDAEDFVHALLGMPSTHTAILLAQTQGRRRDGENAWEIAYRTTEPFAKHGFSRPPERHCAAQIGQGSDFVYACGRCSPQQELTLLPDFAKLICELDLRFKSSMDWRVGVGISVHSAYVALSHAESGQLWVDDTLGPYVEKSMKTTSKGRPSQREDLMWNACSAHRGEFE